jgi:intracellular sulfur oxidation DsrE/DsrF family protein
MPGYLLIESRDPFESTGAARTCELAVQLRAAGHDVALFLVQNGVLAVRSGARRAQLDMFEKVIGKIEVLADDFSLRERGIPTAALIGGVRAAPIDSIVERMAAGWNALWH